MKKIIYALCALLCAFSMASCSLEDLTGSLDGIFDGFGDINIGGSESSKTYSIFMPTHTRATTNLVYPQHNIDIETTSTIKYEDVYENDRLVSRVTTTTDEFGSVVNVRTNFLYNSEGQVVAVETFATEDIAGISLASRDEYFYEGDRIISFDTYVYLSGGKVDYQSKSEVLEYDGDLPVRIRCTFYDSNGNITYLNGTAVCEIIYQYDNKDRMTSCRISYKNDNNEETYWANTYYYYD